MHEDLEPEVSRNVMIIERRLLGKNLPSWLDPSGLFIQTHLGTFDTSVAPPIDIDECHTLVLSAPITRASAMISEKKDGEGVCDCDKQFALGDCIVSVRLDCRTVMVCHMRDMILG